MSRKPLQEIENELESAKRKVKIGEIYSHYKDEKHLVKVIDVGVQEATEKICVIYQDIATKLIFVRDLDIWLQKPLKDTPRFKLVSD